MLLKQSWGKFIVLIAPIRKQERFWINNLSFFLRKQKRRENLTQHQHKEGHTKEKSKLQWNWKQKATEKIHRAKNWILKNNLQKQWTSNQINFLNARHKLLIKNERRNITDDTDLTKLRGYYKLCANTFD